MSELALFVRNFHQNGKGTVEEIGFEEFLVVMSHFRPPSLHMTEDQRESVRREKLRCAYLDTNHLLVSDSRLVKLQTFSAVLFNMHDTDNDGTITLEEYRHVSLTPSLPSSHHPQEVWCSPNTSTSVQVVEELLSRSGALGKETAKSIADAAMLEVASISVGHMVRKLQCWKVALSRIHSSSICLYLFHRSLMSSMRG